MPAPIREAAVHDRPVAPSALRITSSIVCAVAAVAASIGLGFGQLPLAAVLGLLGMLSAIPGVVGPGAAPGALRVVIAGWGVGAPMLVLLAPSWAGLWPAGALLALAHRSRREALWMAGLSGVALLGVGLARYGLLREPGLGQLAPSTLSGALAFGLAYVAAANRTAVLDEARGRLRRQSAWLHRLPHALIELDPHRRIVDLVFGQGIPAPPDAWEGQPLHAVWPDLSEALDREGGMVHTPALGRVTVDRGELPWGHQLVRVSPARPMEPLDACSETRVLQAGRLAHMGVLATGVAHEINTPLAYLMTNLQFIDAALDRRDPELTEALEDAIQGARRIQGIVRDIEVFSRSDDSDLLELLDPADVLHAAVRPLRQKMEARAEFRVQHGPAPRVLANPARLSQAVLNLLSNAILSIPVDRRGRIDLSTGRVPETGEAFIEVKDDGVGIPTHQVRRVFEPFFTTRPVGQGTGLGLSITYGLVRRLGGDVDVDSIEGVGSTFRIRLPDGDSLNRLRGGENRAQPRLAD